MFVLCPHCQFLVAVEPASGQPPARCPRCDGPLAEAPASAESGASTDDAIDAAVAAVDPAPAIEQPAESGAAPPAAIAPHALPVAASGAGPGEAIDEDTSPAVATLVIAPSEPGEDADAAPEVRTPAPAPAAPPRRRRSATLPVLALSLLLALQLTLAERAALASDPQWRPAIALLCNVLHCSLPPWREPEALTFLERNVAPDPNRPGVLHVTARVRNDARWTQAWPELLLTLSDADGRVAGERRFAAAEYLGHPPTANGLASGQIVAIAMDVIEPAPHIVAFTFDVR